jgi:NAD(P)-dependent dehydrogenase (short-subunit alcohol dehydrogenase family)
VALLARGQAGLYGAVKDVENAGGTALAIPTNVADPAQVDAAADRVEQVLGPIDIWVNVAFTSVFAPFHEITPQEFRQVTEVSYLGYVYGTMAALARMRPRQRGTIVQVGSALGIRSIPLQAAYCGAKHAVNGFTESLRTELLHEDSNIHITVVQMPAVNTPADEPRADNAHAGRSQPLPRWTSMSSPYPTHQLAEDPARPDEHLDPPSCPPTPRPPRCADRNRWMES